MDGNNKSDWFFGSDCPYYKGTVGRIVRDIGPVLSNHRTNEAYADCAQWPYIPGVGDRQDEGCSSYTSPPYCAYCEGQIEPIESVRTISNDSPVRWFVPLVREIQAELHFTNKSPIVTIVTNATPSQSLLSVQLVSHTGTGTLFAMISNR